MSKTFAELFERAKKRLSYHVQGAILKFTESMAERMESLQISNAELAKKLDCKPSYVTKVLRGGTNFTLQSMVKIAWALDSEVAISLVPKLTSETWGQVIQNKSRQARIPQRQIQFEWSGSLETMVPSGTETKPNDELALAA